MNMFRVPVVDKNQNPLMPTTILRARRWIRERKATPFWKRGVFCVRLNQEPSDTKTQKVTVGIDPGSKKEGFTIKSEAHTFLNIQADAVSHVKERVETRRTLRRNRRNRKTPYRQCRSNRNINTVRLPPSTKARWAWKLRILNWLRKMFPINSVVVEDIQAKTFKNGRKWNLSFSPLQIGKAWFYEQIRSLGLRLDTLAGHETKALRDGFGLHKLKNKMANNFYAHCVDSWVLANWFTGGHVKPDNEQMLYLTPIQFQRRNLHDQLPTSGGTRRRAGGTISLGLKKGQLAKHPKHGLCYVGGNMNDRLTVCDVHTGARLARNVRPESLRLLAYNSWRFA